MFSTEKIAPNKNHFRIHQQHENCQDFDGTKNMTRILDSFSRYKWLQPVKPVSYNSKANHSVTAKKRLDKFASNQNRLRYPIPSANSRYWKMQMKKCKRNERFPTFLICVLLFSPLIFIWIRIWNLGYFNWKESVQTNKINANESLGFKNKQI